MKKEKDVQPDARIRVMVVDDHPVMRQALRTIINSQPDLTLAAEAESGRAAIDLLERSRPEVVLMDGSMPEMNGMETTRRLKKLQPNLKVIGLTLYEQSSYLEEMISVGASGYVLKTGTPSDIVDAVHTVAAGGTYFDPSVRRQAATPSRPRAGVQQLSPEELAVVKLVADGRTNSEVAASLGLTLATVEARREAAMQKLKLRTRAQLVRVATERHWLDA
jgi:DNA-binding NarL/FixJ family response regulator